MNRSPEDAFPTTIDDLQGFWDMVYLQVTHVDSIFADIEKLKANDWIVSHARLGITCNRQQLFISHMFIYFAAY